MMRGAKIIEISPLDISVEVDAKILEGFGRYRVDQGGTLTALAAMELDLELLAPEILCPTANARSVQTMIAPAVTSVFVSMFMLCSAPLRLKRSRIVDEPSPEQMTGERAGLKFLAMTSVTLDFSISL